jgi:hypothetical protein
MDDCTSMRSSKLKTVIGFLHVNFVTARKQAANFSSSNNFLGSVYIILLLLLSLYVAFQMLMLLHFGMIQVYTVQWNPCLMFLRVIFSLV